MAVQGGSDFCVVFAMTLYALESKQPLKISSLFFNSNCFYIRYLRLIYQCDSYSIHGQLRDWNLGDELMSLTDIIVEWFLKQYFYVPQLITAMHI